MKHVGRLKVMLAGRLVGQLLADARGRIWFEYDAAWLAAGFDLAPRSLVFSGPPQLAASPLFQGLHGVFNDSLPDGWGWLLMDREFRRRFGWSPHDITPLDRLAYIGGRAMGALEYVPAYDSGPIADEVDLRQLADSAESLLQGSDAEVLAQLRIQGGSPGGARPKVTIARQPGNPLCLSGFQDLPAGYAHWIVKFRGENDPRDMGRREKAYADMARLAGLEMPETDLIALGAGPRREDFFAVRRFDRDAQGGRRHVLSLAGLLYADFRTPCLDYETVLQVTSLLTRHVGEVERAYRLMLFNILAHNQDDHAKNFSLIAEANGDWRLSPAFDLTFSRGMGGQHTTAVLGHSNPGRREVLRLGEKFQLRRAPQIVEEVREAVARWPQLAREAGVTQAGVSENGKVLREIDGRFRG